mgnify:CR=1 FL=1
MRGIGAVRPGARTGAIGAVTTHDLDLADDPALAPSAHLVHFQEVLDDEAAQGSEAVAEQLQHAGHRAVVLLADGAAAEEATAVGRSVAVPAVQGWGAPACVRSWAWG